MEFILHRMNIKNFKGIKSLSIDFGKTTSVCGKNGTGKTSIVDAFYWLMFNKDSQGNAPGSDKFREKPLDSKGEEIHKVVTSVEAIATLDGKPFNLRREQSESWTKKRGSSEAVYQGNVSKYFINDVERKVSEFKEAIGNICSQETFGYIATLSSFNNSDWKKRRAVLSEMVSDEVISGIMQEERFVEINKECSERNLTVEEFRTVLKQNVKKNTDELSSIGPRIDECNRFISEAPSKSEAESLRKEEDEIDSCIRKASNSIEDLVRSSAVNESPDLRKTLSDSIASKKSQIESIKSSMSGIFKRIDQEKDTRESLIKKRDSLREEYKATYSSEFKPHEIPSTCPVCMREISEDVRLSIVEQEKKRFDSEKLKSLGEIKTAGTDVASWISEIDDVLAKYEEELESWKKQIKEAQDEFDELNSRYISSFNAKTEPDDFSEQISIAQVEKKRLEERKQEISEKLMQYGLAEKQMERIAKLKDEASSLSDKIVSDEKRLMLLDELVSEQCKAVENAVNQMFPSLRWKMFNQQINGGYVETCVCMIPCGGSLVMYDCANTASKLHADIEVIDVLSKFYDVKMPVFFDNRERVNSVYPIDTQLVTLSVSNDEKLKVC